MKFLKRFFLWERIGYPWIRSILWRARGTLFFGLIIALGLALWFPAPSQATLPVIDMAAVGQLIQQSVQFSQHLVMMAQQIVLLKQEVQSLSGNYGIGSMAGPVNGWGTTSWNDIVAMVNTGMNPGDASQVALYQSAKTKYQSAFPPVEADLATPNPRLSAVYTNTYQSSIAGLSSGESTVNGLPGRLAQLQVYQNKIDHTDNVKAAMDLNTAVEVQNAEINAELLRTNAMQLYLAANAQTGTTSGQAAQAEFFSN